MLNKLRSLLSQCHTKKSSLTQVLEKASDTYCITRAMEILEKREPSDAELIQVIQLVNLARYKRTDSK